MKTLFVCLMSLFALSAEAARYDLYSGQSINILNRYGGTDLVTCNASVTPPPPVPPSGSVWEGRIVGHGPGCNGGLLTYNPVGSACSAGDTRFSANCYYLDRYNGAQWVFSCPASTRGTWKSRIVGNGPGCNGGLLGYNPVGQSCTVGDRSSYPQNCYYLGTGNDGRDQYVFDCTP